jgi:uncharacterized protein
MKVINGQKFKMLLISAANNLYNHYPEIDALNVFPVPDGDTGMNMNLTMSSGAKEIMNRNDTSIYEISKVFSRGLLMGARGNSGVITSQIFRGINQALEGKEEINALDLAYAFDNGRKVAYKAVIKPVEGTILTVIRESSNYLLDKVNEKTTIEEALDLLLKEAKASLSRTPNLLPVLKEVGVVDSGGAGLVKIFEGMDSAAHGEFVEKNAATVIDAKSNEEEQVDDNVIYDTDFILKLGPKGNKKPFQNARFSSVISGRGTNFNIEQNENIIKIHIKTQDIGEVISYAQSFGEFVSLNVKSSITPIEDNKNEVSKEENNEILDDKIEITNEYALIATSSGPGIDKFFHEVGVNFIVSGGQTMNPSTEDFLKAIKEAKAKVVYVFPNNGNIILAANQAKDVLKGKVDVVVIPTKTIMQGIVSSMMFTPDVSKNENIKNMEEAIKSVKSGSVTFAIKDTDINGVHVAKDEFMAIRESKDIIFSNSDKIITFKTLIEKLVDDNSAIITVILGKDITSEEEEIISTYLNDKYEDFDIDIRRGDQPIYSFLVGVE